MTSSTQHGAPVNLRNLTKKYGNFVAVQDVDLDVAAGEFLTLLGASGSGKTTTLSMIAGFTQPTDGRVLIKGEDVTSVPPHKRSLGMVFQQYSLFPHMSVVANVAFPLKQRGTPKKERLRMALEALDMVELGDKAQSSPKELSGGQQQRVAIARALVFSPKVLLMDEPFGALDRALRERMQIEVRRIHQDIGTTIIFVTHDQQEALTLSSRIAVFDRGRIVQVGTPEELYQRPNSLLVGTFLGESNLIPGTVRSGRFIARSGTVLPVESRSDVANCQLFIRPENIELFQGESDASNYSGIIRDIAYLGSDRRIEIETPDATLIARVPGTSTTFMPGSPVRISWRSEHASVFSMESSTT